MKTILTWTVALTLTLAALAYAALPQTISYQGYLKDSNGAPVKTTVDITFKLYSSTSGANPLWSGTPQSVTPTNGTYSTQIGPTSLPFDRQYWLGVSAGTDPEMRPLQPLTSTPYAQRSTVADTVPDGAITDAKISGPITGSKIPDLAGLQASITALQSTVASQQTAITTQQSAITSLQSTVTSQQGTITGQQSVIDALQIQISHLNTPPDVVTGGDITTSPGTLVILYGKVTDADQFQSLTWSWSIVSKPGGSIAALSSTADAVTTFTPDLAGAYQFRLTASDGISTVTADKSLTVTAGMLGRAQKIESHTIGDVQAPRIAMDGKGTAMAVWPQYDGQLTSIRASRFTPGSGWSAPQSISDTTKNAYTPQVAMDAKGNAAVVWGQNDGSLNNIWAIRFTASTGLWGAAQLIDIEDGQASAPQVAMDSNGIAVAVWQQSDGLRDNIWANRYTDSSGVWGTALKIETNDTGSAYNPQVAMDSNGNAMAVWQQYDGFLWNIWANRCNVFSGVWGTAVKIETDDTGSAQYPRVAMDRFGYGNTIVVWQQHDGVRNNIWANRYTDSGKVWGTAVKIATSTGNAIYPKVATDNSGNAVAVWQQSDGSRFNVWANRYSVSSGFWGTAVKIESSAYDALELQLAMDSIGNAVAVWQQMDISENYNIYVSRHSNVSGLWGSAQLIESISTSGSTPHVAIDSSGYAVAVWNQSDGPYNNIWANTISLGWMEARKIETHETNYSNNSKVAMDANGNAIAVWQQLDGIRFNVWANRYSATSGLWGTPHKIEFDDTGDAQNPKVAMDASGNAVVVWQQFDGLRDNIWANRYTASSGLWGVALKIETDDIGSAGAPQIAMDSSGNAVAVWLQSDGSRVNVWANRYSAASGLWGVALKIETDDTSDAGGPQVAMDASGNAVAVWYQHDGIRNNIWANRYSVTSGLWDTALKIETDNTGDAGAPQVAMDTSGNAVAVWQQFDGSYSSIYTCRYSQASNFWSAPQLVENSTNNAYDPQVAINSSGTTLYVWSQFDGFTYNIWTRFYSSLGWGTPQMINSGGNGYGPQVAINNSGTSVVAWYQHDGIRNNIWATSFIPADAAWSDSLLIDSDNGGDAVLPQVAISLGGTPLVVWQQNDGLRGNIWANRPWK